MTSYEVRNALRPGDELVVRALIADGVQARFKETVICAPDASADGKWSRGELVLAKVDIYERAALVTPSQIERSIA